MPLNVKLPEVVTVPLNVNPDAVPVPATDVTVPVFVVYPLGLVALYGVYPNAVVTFSEVTDNVPPSVIVPAVVMVPPVKVSPLTVPVVATDVTVPVLVVYPAGFETLYGVYPNADVTCSVVKLSAPPNVKLPDDVTVPDNVNPETVPVPLTDVTAPVLVAAMVIVPAPLVTIIPSPAVSVVFVSVVLSVLPISNCPLV